MPSIFIKDSLRASVENASGGLQTVLYTSTNQPTFMNVVPKFKSIDVDSGLPDAVHPAFIVNGVEKSELFIGTYPGIVKNNELLSLPNVVGTTSILLSTAIEKARMCGKGHHVMTNIEASAIALWCHANSFTPRGNTFYGKSLEAPWEAGRRSDKLTPGTTSGLGNTVAGSGPVSWRHNNSVSGISDLVGNTWEWSTGLRLVAGEIQVIPNNDAALISIDLSESSVAWKAIDGETGALVVPGSANTVKYAAAGTTAYSLVRPSNSSFELMTNPGTTPVSSAALSLLKTYGLYPVASLLGGTLAAPVASGDVFLFDATSERVAVRFGSWVHPTSGLFALHLSSLRSGGGVTFGVRPAFVL